MGQARNRAKTFEERKAIAIQRQHDAEVARQKVLDDELNQKLIAELTVLANREGTSLISEEEIRAMPYEKRLRIYRQAHTTNRLSEEKANKVIVAPSPRYSAFGERRVRSHSAIMAAALALSLGSRV